MKMSLFYGCQEKTKNEIDELKSEVDNKLSLSGGKMCGDIDMSLWRIKNIPTPIFDCDVISKTIQEKDTFQSVPKYGNTIQSMLQVFTDLTEVRIIVN